MRITFFCESCRSELTVASHFAGRAILCPRCRKRTQIPTASSPTAHPSAPDVSRDSSNVSFKPCADFAPNPFAFSVRLEAFAPEIGGEEDAPNVDAAASKTPSVNELIATLLDEDNR